MVYVAEHHMIGKGQRCHPYWRWQHTVIYRGIGCKSVTLRKRMAFGRLAHRGFIIRPNNLDKSMSVYNNRDSLRLHTSASMCRTAYALRQRGRHALPGDPHRQRRRRCTRYKRGSCVSRSASL